MNKKYILAALAALTMFACKPETVIPDPEPQPEPEPVVPVDPEPETIEVKEGYIYRLNADRTEALQQIEIGSTASFVVNAGFFGIYVSDRKDLSKQAITTKEDFFDVNDNVVAVAILNQLNGKEIVMGSEKLSYMFSAQIQKLFSFDIANNLEDERIKSGTFTLKVDVAARKADFQFSLNLKDGSILCAKVSSEYTPGGENDTLFLLGDFSRPVRAGFYDAPVSDSREETIYLTNGEIDYGEELDRTTYFTFSADKSLFNGQPVDVAAAQKAGTLETFLRDFDSEWYLKSGSLTINKTGEHEYEITLTDGVLEDLYSKLSDNTLTIIYHGTLKDVNVERQVVSKFTYNGNEHGIGSCVVDLRSEVAAIYMTEQSGIKTVEEALAAKPIVINMTARKYGTSVGLSTDKENFCVAYDGNVWNRDNLDTGSLIFEKYDSESGAIHFMVQNLWYVTNKKVPFSLEYKDTPVYIR